MLIAQHNDDSLNDESLRALCDQQANQGGFFLLNLRSCPKEQDSTWDTSLGFWTNLPGLIRSFAEPGEDLHLHFDSARRVAEAAVESAIARFQANWIGATVGRYFLHRVANAVGWNTGKGGPQESRANQSGVTGEIVPDIPNRCGDRLGVTRTDCCQSIFPRLPEVTGRRYYHLNWKKSTSRDIWDKSKTRTTKPRQHGRCQSGKNGSSSDSRNLGHPQPTELARALRHAGATREAIRFVLKELRCPTCEARPPPLPPRPGMLPHCLLLTSALTLIWLTWKSEMETSAKALDVVCWGTGLQIVQPLWTSHTAKTVMKEFKVVWMKHYGWAEIIVHDQGPEFMGSEFQNPAGAAGVLTMPIDSQSPWQNGKTYRAGQSFKHHLWDLDEECHIEGETEFEASVAECCDARNRYCSVGFLCASARVWFQSAFTWKPVERRSH